MKGKIFTTLTIFTSLALMACGGKPAADTSAVPSSQHKHSYVYTQTKAPTCTEKGLEEGVCECGDKTTKNVNALGHDFTAWAEVTPATCAAPGLERRTCQRQGCTEKEERPIKALPHTWIDQGPVSAPGEGGAVYHILECSACHKIGICGSFVDSEINGGHKTVTTADGQFVKLNDNDGTFTVKINVPETYAKAGTMYLYACMGHWRGSNGSTDNSTESYYSGNSETGNFKLEVNGEAIDYSAMRDLTYADIINDPDPGDSNGYSKAAYCEVGRTALQSGLNTIVYTRLASYNLTIQSFVVALD